MSDDDLKRQLENGKACVEATLRELEAARAHLAQEREAGILAAQSLATAGERIAALTAERDAVLVQFRKILAVDACPDSTLPQFAETIAQMVQDLADAHQDAGRMWGQRLRERDGARAELARCNDRLEAFRRILAPVLELEAKATPGPWHREYLELKPGGVMTLGIGAPSRAVCIVNGIVESPIGLADVHFVTAARNALPELRAELEKP